MRSKLNFLINNSLKKKIKSKWFLISNIIIALLMIAIINIDSIITLFGGDFDSKTKIYILDSTNELSETFKQNLKYYENTLYNDTDIYDVIVSNDSKEALEEKIKTEENNSILITFDIIEEEISSKLITLSTIDSYDYQLINSAATSTISLYNINSLNLTEDEIKKITNPFILERVILDDNVTSETENTEMIMTTVFPILILPFFMLTIFLVQLIGSEINDEKSTRSMEIIISNVSPKKHFLAKIISNNLFIFLQIILMVIYVVIGIGIRNLVGGNSIVNGVAGEVITAINSLKLNVFNGKFVLIIIFTIILMLFTLISYSLVAGILASMSTNAEDYQQVQVPIVVTLLLGYYLSIMAGMFKGSLFIKILSCIPFISAILSPSLLVMGQIGVIEVLISIILILATIFLLVKYGIRIYKVGILNYSSTGIWKKILKSLRNK